MTLAIDGSSPAAVGSTGASQTTASFTPPSGSLLVACAAADGNTAGHTITFSDSLTGSWTKFENQNGSNGGHTAIAVSAGGGSALTVNAVNSDSATSTQLKVYVLTGNTPTAGASATPTFQSGSGVMSISMTGPTTTHTNTIVFWAAVDFSAQNTPSSSDLTIGAFNIGPNFITGLTGYKSVATASTPTGNYNGGNTTGYSLDWTALEVYEASGGAPAVDVEPNMLIIPRRYYFIAIP